MALTFAFERKSCYYWVIRLTDNWSVYVHSIYFQLASGSVFSDSHNAAAPSTFLSPEISVRIYHWLLWFYSFTFVHICFNLLLCFLHCSLLFLFSVIKYLLTCKCEVMSGVGNGCWCCARSWRPMLCSLEEWTGRALVFRSVWLFHQSCLDYVACSFFAECSRSHCLGRTSREWCASFRSITWHYYFASPVQTGLHFESLSVFVISSVVKIMISLFRNWLI